MEAKKYSKFQTAVFKFVATGTGHGVVRARAGCGKTTTVVEACNHAPKGARVLFVAFNKVIAEELKTRVPANTEACTLHSFGLRCLRMAANKQPRIDGDKDEILAREALPSDAARPLIGLLQKLVSMAKANLATTVDELTDLGMQYECAAPPGFDPAEWAQTALRVMDRARTTWQHGVSFDDMIWLPVVLDMRVPAFDLVFIDETQDLNRAQIELAMKAAGQAGRIIAVGDDKQAIYGFRGADSGSIPKIIERLNAKVLPLSITYRCATAIVAEAQKYVPDIQAAKGAPEGTVTRDTSLVTLPTKVRAGHFVVSRINAPLVRLCLATLRAGTPAFVRGRDIGAGLSALVRQSKRDTLSAFTEWLQSYADAEREKISKRKNADALLDALDDKVSTLHALGEGLTTTAELLARIGTMFSDDKGGRVMFSSTHKAKGLEAPEVYVLRDTYNPTKDEEEANLLYVAVTRAQSALHYVSGK